MRTERNSAILLLRYRCVLNSKGSRTTPAQKDIRIIWETKIVRETEVDSTSTSRRKLGAGPSYMCTGVKPLLKESRQTTNRKTKRGTGIGSSKGVSRASIYVRCWQEKGRSEVVKTWGKWDGRGGKRWSSFTVQPRQDLKFTRVELIFDAIIGLYSKLLSCPISTSQFVYLYRIYILLSSFTIIDFFGFFGFEILPAFLDRQARVGLSSTFEFQCRRLI